MKNETDAHLKPMPAMKVYDKLFAAWGPQHWWPGETRLEIIVGAILTQNTAWTNVEKAIVNLKKARALNLERLHRASRDELAAWIRPAGYFNIKAKRLKCFFDALHNTFDGSLRKMFARETAELRAWLLNVNGIGPETADSILLYAGNRPVFVIDAYTKRFMSRHGWCAGNAPYDELAAQMVSCLPNDIQLYNEYHALIVHLGKDFCRPKPRCEQCPLNCWPTHV